MRSVALLLVLVGLQGGAFRILDAEQERYLGPEATGAAVLAESRKPDPAGQLPSALHMPPASRAPVAAAFEHRRPAASGGFETPPHRFPDPTGPPRA